MPPAPYSCPVKNIDTRADAPQSDTADVGSVTAAGVPRYILYGDATARPDWFVNVEPLDQRSREQGGVIAPHTHPRFSQIVICVAGGGEMSVEGETHVFGRGSVMIVPPHRIHGFRYDATAAGWVLTIESSYLADLLVRAPVLSAIFRDPGVFDLGGGVLPALETEVAALGSELGDAREGSAIGAEIRLLSLILAMLRHWPAGAKASHATQGKRSELVARFRQIVERRFREQPSLDDIASELGVSVSQLRLACNSVAGVSPIAMLHDRILAEAKRCLAYTVMSISEIADWLGFSDAAYFSRFFTKLVKQAPTAYRRKQASPV